MHWLKRQRVRYTLHHHSINFEIWEKTLLENIIFEGLTSVEKAHLRELATLFLQRKKLIGVQGLVLNTDMAVCIAAQACLPILKLGLHFYDGWIEVLIYPGLFRVKREKTNAAGLVEQEEQVLSGEAWSKGPVIIAWEEVSAELANASKGHSVVIHELAHKLDMLNGTANGMPPLHRDMERARWTSALSNAYNSLSRDLSRHHKTHINVYAATSPAEFFAVVSEYFFVAPITLQTHYPEVYKQLALFYRQDPVRRRIVKPR